VIALAATLIVVLLGVSFSGKPIKQYTWPVRALSVLGALGLISGGFLVLVSFVLGTTADSAIASFYFAGYLAYLLVINTIIQVRQTSRSCFGMGFIVLILLSTWSWTSAIAMYFHRGAGSESHAACILIPRPTGTVILDYHAILVAPDSVDAPLYNWSKKRMRFEILDAKRNPHLPSECPPQI